MKKSDLIFVVISRCSHVFNVTNKNILENFKTEKYIKNKILEGIRKQLG